MSSEIYTRQEGLGLKANTSITVVGCGGIGFWVSKFAAMSGINTIYLFDPDTFEIHNLNRIDVSEELLGKNKAQVTKIIIEGLRPDCNVKFFPFKLQEHTWPRTEWLVDCTDLTASQQENQRIAQKFGARYLKAGYNGEHMSIHDSVAEWGEAVDGYTVIPSWVVPAVMVSALTVAKIMKYQKYEMANDVAGFFNYKNKK